MKKDLGPRGEQFPQLVMIIGSYDEKGVPAAMNAAWVTMVSKDKVEINVSSHQSTDNILARRAFTVAPADLAHLVPADYVGIESGRRVANKAEKSGLTFVRSKHVDAPVIEEFPVTLECEVVSVEGDASDARIIGRIVNTLADEEVLDEEGRVDLGRVRPIVYDATRRIYRVVGDEVGTAWGSGLELR